MAITPQTVGALPLYGTSMMNTSYFPVTKQHGITSTTTHSAVHKWCCLILGCCITGPNPVRKKKKKVVKHRNIIPISPKGGKMPLNAFWVRPELLKLEFHLPGHRDHLQCWSCLVLATLPTHIQKKKKKSNDSIYFNYIDKSHESNSTLHLFSHWDRHGHVNSVWKAETGSFASRKWKKKTQKK